MMDINRMKVTQVKYINSERLAVTDYTLSQWSNGTVKMCNSKTGKAVRTFRNVLEANIYISKIL